MKKEAIVKTAVLLTLGTIVGWNMLSDDSKVKKILSKKLFGETEEVQKEEATEIADFVGEPVRKHIGPYVGFYETVPNQEIGIKDNEKYSFEVRKSNEKEERIVGYKLKIFYNAENSDNERFRLPSIIISETDLPYESDKDFKNDDDFHFSARMPDNEEVDFSAYYSGRDIDFTINDDFSKNSFRDGKVDEVRVFGKGSNDYLLRTDDLTRKEKEVFLFYDKELANLEVKFADEIQKCRDYFGIER